MDVNALGVSALSLSGHKFGTPQGIGLLWVKRGTPLRTLMSGGGHERGRRSGTSNVAGAVGLATALELAEREREQYAARVAALRDRLIDGILETVPGALLTGPDPRETVKLQESGVAADATAEVTHVTDPDSADIAAGASAAKATAASSGLNGITRLPTTALFCFPGVNGETVLVDLENQEVLVSSGSACATGSSEPSHVLTAMGFPRRWPPPPCASAWAKRPPRRTSTTQSAPPRRSSRNCAANPHADQRYDLDSCRIRHYRRLIGTASSATAWQVKACRARRTPTA